MPMQRSFLSFSSMVALAALAACAPGRVAVVGPMASPQPMAESLQSETRLVEPTRIDFTWELNEAGARVKGVGVARVEPPYRARLDLFLEKGETVISAALVGDDLRLPPGAPDDILPPVALMWGTLGVFRPIEGARLIGGDRLENRAERLRYAYTQDRELHFEVGPGTVLAVELLEGASVVEWVRLETEPEGSYPASATYRNLIDFRELKIVTTSVRRAGPFESAIWDPR
jgi:hypothetical protein